MALALDGDEASIRRPGDEIDTDFAGVDPGQLFSFGPVPPRPDMFDFEGAVGESEGAEELLEPSPFSRSVRLALWMVSSTSPVDFLPLRASGSCPSFVLVRRSFFDWTTVAPWRYAR